MHAPEGATKADIAGVNANIAEMEARLERSLREMSLRFLTLLIASQAVLFAGLRLTGG